MRDLLLLFLIIYVYLITVDPLDKIINWQEKIESNKNFILGNATYRCEKMNELIEE